VKRGVTRRPKVAGGAGRGAGWRRKGGSDKVETEKRRDKDGW